MNENIYLFMGTFLSNAEKNILLILLTFFVVGINPLYAQDFPDQVTNKVDEVKKDIKDRLENPFSISGSIGMNLGLYQAFGIESRRDNFSYLFTTNLNASLLGVGIDIPLDGNFSQLDASFLQPFNQVGISPKYKWATAHLGYRNMNFSPLTLSGHTFLGVGLELTPPIKSKLFSFRFSGMYGRLRRPVEAIEAAENNVQPTYRRMGYGFKAGIISKKQATNYIDLILFRGYDEINSIQQPFGNNAIKPEDNLVLGATGQYQLFKALTLKADWAVSAFTRDRRSEGTRESLPVFSDVEGLFVPNISTQIRQSVKSSLSYKFSNYRIGVKYNRIAPDYRTLGAYYFQDDLEDYTFNGSAMLKEGKTVINGSIGFQRNNLNEDLDNRSKRVIGSLSLNQVFSPEFNMYASYSNFSSSLLAVKEELSDSLDFYQVSTGYTLGANYNLGTKERRQSLSGNISYQTANSRDEYSISDITTEFLTGGMFYNLFVTKKNIGFNATISYTQSKSQDMEATIIGPGIGLVKKFPKKGISAKYYASYRTNFQDGSSTFSVLQNRFGLDYKISKHHNVGVKLSHLYKIDGINDENTYSEIQGMTSYLFTF
ncbi:MAG: hypothetical protein ACJAYJ_005037 [Saprospiraceae bacterium]|jgi:hypothetical protein